MGCSYFFIFYGGGVSWFCHGLSWGTAMHSHDNAMGYGTINTMGPHDISWVFTFKNITLQAFIALPRCFGAPTVMSVIF